MIGRREPLYGTFGAVCASNHIAAAVGMAILDRGGNAFDAAAAAAFAIQVLEPDQNGPAGEVVAIFYSARDEKASVLCGQGVAPRAATRRRFKELGFSDIPSKGLLPAVTPGNLDAWLLLLRGQGTASLATVLEPAIGYAGAGFPVSRRTAAHIEKFKRRFTEAWHSTAAVFLPSGRPPVPYQRVCNTALSRTFQRIVSEAQASSSDRDDQIEAARRIVAAGFVCEEIDRFCRQPAVDDFRSMQTHSGLLTGDDIVGWRASFEDPIQIHYGTWTVLKPGPWSQGPAMLQQLALLESSDPGSMDPTGADFVHCVVEAAKLAYADRAGYYGDPRFVSVPLAELLAPDYIADRARLIGRQASADFSCGQSRLVPDAADRLRRRLSDLFGREGTTPRLSAVAEKCTVHIDVVDRWGNMISATQSGGWIDDSPVIPALGFPLSTRGQMFTLSEHSPNGVEPGKRPLTTLSPTLVLRNGEPHLVYGTPGADQQDQWGTIFFLRYAHGMNLADANVAPLFHTRHLLSSFSPPRFAPKSLLAEATFDPGVLADLRERGHSVEAVETFTSPLGILNFGTLSAIAKEGPLLAATGSPRWPHSFAYVR